MSGGDPKPFGLTPDDYENLMRFDPIETHFYQLMTAAKDSGLIPITTIWQAADRYGLGDYYIQSMANLNAIYLEVHDDGDTDRRSQVSST